METKKFEFNKETINFEIESKNVMVNATEMANVFGKKCIEFMAHAQKSVDASAP